LEGLLGCVPIHSSAYGFFSSMLKSEGVAAAKRAAAESLPTFPILVHQSFAWVVVLVAKAVLPHS
jgi:hypothetical protein